MNEYYKSYKDLSDAIKVGVAIPNAQEVLKNFKTLVYKNVPTTPSIYKEEWGTDVVCPSCNTEFGDEQPRYCCECGQRIDWSIND